VQHAERLDLDRHRILGELTAERRFGAVEATGGECGAQLAVAKCGHRAIDELDLARERDRLERSPRSYGCARALRIWTRMSRCCITASRCERDRSQRRDSSDRPLRSGIRDLDRGCLGIGCDGGGCRFANRAQRPRRRGIGR